MKNENGLIYKAINTKNGKIYIGATTKCMDDRIADHLDKSSRDEGGYFQTAIATYGCDAFEWEEIDTANDINDLANKEKEYIFKYDSRENGYNSDSGGGFKKMVYQFDLRGNLINEFDSLSTAASTIGVDKKRISQACLSSTHLLNSQYWSYNKKFTIKDSYDKRKKVVCKYEINGEFVAKYKSVAEASRQTGISKTCISRCCRGERKYSSGFIWKYKL